MNVTRPKCPVCGSRKITYVQWGYPVYSEDTMEKIHRKEIMLGGCMVSSECREWLCQDCHSAFGKTGLDELVMYKDNKPDYISAYFDHTSNSNKLIQSKTCGCFNCLSVFSPGDIKEWVEDIGEYATGLCPYCQLDTVIGDSIGVSITTELLQKMNNYWMKDSIDKDSFFAEGVKE